MLVTYFDIRGHWNQKERGWRGGVEEGQRDRGMVSLRKRGRERGEMEKESERNERERDREIERAGGREDETGKEG